MVNMHILMLGCKGLRENISNYLSVSLYHQAYRDMNAHSSLLHAKTFFLSDV